MYTTIFVCAQSEFNIFFLYKNMCIACFLFLFIVEKGEVTGNIELLKGGVMTGSLMIFLKVNFVTIQFVFFFVLQSAFAFF